MVLPAPALCGGVIKAPKHPVDVQLPDLRMPRPVLPSGEEGGSFLRRQRPPRCRLPDGNQHGPHRTAPAPYSGLVYSNGSVALR